MRFTVSADSGASVRVLFPEGELDLASAENVIKAAEEALGDGGVTELVLDLSRLTFLDCSGIGALIRVRQLAAERGTPCDIRNSSGLPRKLLVLTGIVGE